MGCVTPTGCSVECTIVFIIDMNYKDLGRPRFASQLEDDTLINRLTIIVDNACVMKCKCDRLQKQQRKRQI